MLRDEKWFLIKRRRSIRATAAETQQKKPTTANRFRLEAAIAEARLHIPKVYENSIDMPEELCKYPVEGEQEMLEPHEDVDLTGDVKLARDVFVEWCNSGTGNLVQHPCAMTV